MFTTSYEVSNKQIRLLNNLERLAYLVLAKNRSFCQEKKNLELEIAYQITLNVYYNKGCPIPLPAVSEYFQMFNNKKNLGFQLNTKNTKILDLHTKVI